MIMTIAGNNRLARFAANLHNQVTPFSYKSLQDREHLHSSVRFHKEIIAAMKRRDTSQACRLMKEHVLNALEVLEVMFGDAPGEPSGAGFPPYVPGKVGK